jgi:hypothetical protein
VHSTRGPGGFRQHAPRHSSPDRLIVGLLLLLACLGSGCATAVLTRPLDKGAHEVHASLGGPLILLGGVPVPVPIAQVGYRYGLTDSVAIGADVPVTLVVLKNVALDPHVTWFPARSLGVQAESVLVLDPGAHVFRAYPILSGWYRVPVSPSFALLPGISAMRQRRSPHLLVSPSLSGAFAAGRWELLVEAMYLAPNVENTYSTVTYVSPGHGGVGLFFGLGRRFR